MLIVFQTAVHATLRTQCIEPSAEYEDTQIFQLDEELIHRPHTITDAMDPIFDLDLSVNDDAYRLTDPETKDSLYQSWVFHTLGSIIDSLTVITERLHYNPGLNVIPILRASIYRDLASISAIEPLCAEPLHILGYRVGVVSAPTIETLVKAGTQLVDVWNLYARRIGLVHF